MIRQHKIIQRLSLCLLLSFIMSIHNKAFGQYQVGDTVGDFTLTSIYGEKISLFDFQVKHRKA